MTHRAGVDADVGPSWPAPGYDASFEAFYAEQRARAVRLAALLVDDVATAEEIAQEVFARIYVRWGRIGNPPAYLRRAIVNRSRSELRRRRLLRRTPPQRERLAALGADELADAVATLPHRQRVAVVLRYYADLDDEAIAHALGCRPTAVRSILTRALQHLRAQLPP